jgi:threonine efflux protein
MALQRCQIACHPAIFQTIKTRDKAPMDTALVLLSLFLIDSLAIVSPGPSILLVVHAAAERDRRGALLIAVGLAVAGGIWALIAVTGLTAVFELMPSLQTAIRVAGAAYLLYIAVRLCARTQGPSPR